MTWPPRSICSCISHWRVARSSPSASTPHGSPKSAEPSPWNTPSPTAASDPERVALSTFVIAHLYYNVGMNWLLSAPQINRLADLVRLASTADDHAKFPFAANAPPPGTTLTFACRPRRRHSNTTVQNQPESTKINHPKRTISSAQRVFRRNAPEKFFRSNHPTAKHTRPPADRSPDPDRRRTGSNRTEHHRTPNRTIFSAHQYFSTNARENSSGTEHQTAGVTGPQVAPSPDLQRRRAGSNAIERNRTAPNARTQHFQRTAALPPQHARKSLRPERSEQEAATYNELSSCGVTMILQCSSGSPSVSKAPATPSRPTRPVTIGPG